MQVIVPSCNEVCSLSNETDTLDTTKLLKTKQSLMKVLSKYFEEKRINFDQKTVIDCFYFVFDSCPFNEWKKNDWWDQREILKEIRTNKSYRERTVSLLKKSMYSDHYSYKVAEIPDQDEPIVQYASRRERLYLKEGYDNVIDSISHAAFYKEKYTDIYPGLLELLFINNDVEEIIIVDNGTGQIHYKPYRRIAPWRLVFKTYKLIMNWGAYYVGGMHLGLKMTYGRLTCLGQGAVVTQKSFKEIY